MVLGDACTSQTIHKSGSGAWTPVYAGKGNSLAVMSISFMLQDPNQAVVWRGPRKNALIQQFLTEVDWTGDTDGLDYLIVDTPPGTSDEHISTVQYLQRASAISGAVVVTTPEEVSLADVRKELGFCRKTNVPVLGVIENMSSYRIPVSKLHFIDSNGTEDCTDRVLAILKEKCPEVLECTATSQLFGAGGGNGGGRSLDGAERMANEFGVPFWGKLPMDPDLLESCERGRPFVEDFPDREAAQALLRFCSKIRKTLPVDMA